MWCSSFRIPRSELRIRIGSPVDHCDTWVAQPVERLSEEQEIVGSTPTPGTLGIQNEFELQAAWRQRTLIRSAPPVRFRGLQLAIPWSSDNDPRPTPGRRWFESIRDHCRSGSGKRGAGSGKITAASRFPIPASRSPRIGDKCYGSTRVLGTRGGSSTLPSPTDIHADVARPQQGACPVSRIMRVRPPPSALSNAELGVRNAEFRKES